MEKIKKEIIIVYTYLKKEFNVDYSTTPYPGPWKINNNIKNVKYHI